MDISQRTMTRLAGVSVAACLLSFSACDESVYEASDDRVLEQDAVLGMNGTDEEWEEEGQLLEEEWSELDVDPELVYEFAVEDERGAGEHSLDDADASARPGEAFAR